MKKYVLPLLAVGALQSCDPSMLDGDDLGNRCTINDVQGSCSRTDATTLYIKALLLNNNFDCNEEEDIPVGVTVYNNQGGIVSYKFQSDNNPALEDERPNQTVMLNPNQTLAGGIETKNQGAPATVEIRTINQQTGKKEIIDTYTTNCDYTPPCAVACTATCFEITPNNHCQGTSIYSFDLCNKPTTFAGTLTLENGMEFGRYPNNGAHLPIKVYTKYGSQIIKSDTFTVVIEARPVVQLVGRFSMNVNPGEKLYIEIGTQNKITKGNVKLTLSSGGISQQIITPFNDQDCTR